ncbi:recombinase family protein [Undibacterium sp. SXout11W]|uniref:recombinase family protein n=1 Tax=Undibacterium sp. SXout11W TaxID=3413050 RepID=UPI003BF25C99
MINSRVYSYLRFSDPKQAVGHSIERQLQYAERWAAERGLPLDTSLSLRDEGLSAYHQRHVKQGALGTFLLAVSEGRIPSGSVLVVEGLDRLSRAEPIQAQAQLAQIINAGITVVTASDGREYNREGLKAQPMDLVYSLLVMIRAHEESDTKSKRVKAAIRRQCEGWIAGTYKGIIRNGKDPQWVIWNGKEFELVPERAEAVKFALQMFKEGYGGSKIVAALHERNMQVFKLGSTSASMYKMFKRPDLVGTKTLTLDNEEYHLHNYYPRLLSDSEYAELQAMNTTRKRRKGKGDIPGIITGLSILYCGYCGSAVVGQNIMQRNRKPDGSVLDGHRRLICCGHNSGTCPIKGSCSAVPVEKALLSYCSDQLNLSSLVSKDDQANTLQARLVEIKTKTIEAERQLSRVTEALLSDDSGSTPLVFVRKARELEKLIADLRIEENSIEVSLRKTSQRQDPDMADAWSKLVEGTLNQDYETRMRCRQLVEDTFERIVIYQRSMSPEDTSSAKKIDLLLIAKGGNPRLIRIDRKTGAWIRGEEFDA